MSYAVSITVDRRAVASPALDIILSLLQPSTTRTCISFRMTVQSYKKNPCRLTRVFMWSCRAGGGKVSGEYEAVSAFILCASIGVVENNAKFPGLGDISSS